jgi:polysaccharide biosynthesis protein PslJ
MAHPEQADPRRAASLAIAFAGAAGLIASTAFGPKAVAFGALAFLLACLLALRDSFAPIFTWPNALAGLVTVIWLIPIKLYSLPFDVGFNLEAYRALLLVLVLAWVIAGITGRASVDAAGHRWPLLLFTVSTLATQIAYMRGLESSLLQTEALKSLSYFLSFLLAFLLITSMVRSIADVDRLMKVLVLGGLVVAAAALYESRTGHNPFSRLDRWLPFDREPREVFEERGGRLRVHASAQHPIALGCALTMLLPLALYFSQNATSNAGRRLWLAGGLVIAAGAMTTISRTTVIMALVMVVVALRLRPRMLVRYWPVVLLLPFVVHSFAPGVMGGLYKSFFPQQGLVADLSGRAGEGGSGRFADLDPGLELWSSSPIVGLGLGSQLSTGASVGPTAGIPGVGRQTEIIFDDQYLNTLVSAGALGLLAAVWFIWGAAIKLARAARRTTGPPGEAIAACSISCFGFAASLFLFDAFSFVQSTLVFFIIAALGLRLRELTRLQAGPTPSTLR